MGLAWPPIPHPQRREMRWSGVELLGFGVRARVFSRQRPVLVGKVKLSSRSYFSGGNRDGGELFANDRRDARP